MSYVSIINSYFQLCLFQSLFSCYNNSFRFPIELSPSYTCKIYSKTTLWRLFYRDFDKSIENVSILRSTEIQMAFRLSFGGFVVKKKLEKCLFFLFFFFNL